MIEDDEEEIDEQEEVPIETSEIVMHFFMHLKMQEEWADTEWLPNDFKKE